MASFQRLKMEALIPASADCEVQSVIKPFRTSRAVCLIPVLFCCMIQLGHTRLDGQHISCRSSAGRFLVILPIAWTSHPAISIFSYTSRNSCLVSVSVFRITERRRLVSHSCSNYRQQTSTTQGYKNWSHGVINDWITEVNILKNSSTLAVSVSINLSLNLVFSVNDPRETYFVDALRKNLWK